VARRLYAIVCRRLYRDAKGDVKRSIIVAGAGRSGTTWLADIIASQIRARVMFEPFHPGKVADYRQFNYFQYKRPHDEDQALYRYVEKILTGRIRDPWIDRTVESLVPAYRIIKEIRACLLLKWIHERFPEVPILFIVRHPCAVVASRLKLGWATDEDIVPLLSQSDLVGDFLSDKLALIRAVETPEEKHAVIWSVSNLVPLRQFGGVGLNLFFYEDLVLSVENEVRRAFEAIGHARPPSVVRHARRLSTTVRRTSPVVGGGDSVRGWKTELSGEQIDRVHSVVRGFGLDRLYGESELPLAER
jgi:hypothetical protein